MAAPTAALPPLGLTVIARLPPPAVAVDATVSSAEIETSPPPPEVAIEPFWA